MVLGSSFACSHDAVRCVASCSEIGSLDTKIVGRDSAGAKNVASFMPELASRCFVLCCRHISLVLDLLNQEVRQEAAFLHGLTGVLLLL